MSFHNTRADSGRMTRFLSIQSYRRGVVLERLSQPIHQAWLNHGFGR
jgi:hypothetical protein